MSASLTIVTVLFMVTGCGRKIGDACTTSADCDPSRGTRTCDLSQPGGYCVIEGCDARSCPEDSVCVRFFPQDLVSKPCTSGCDVDEECIGTDAEGTCVRRSLERRICVQTCGGNDDCRGGYECVATGVNGAVPLTLNLGSRPKYCRPVSAS